MYKLRYRRPGQWFYRTLRLAGHRLVEHDRLLCSLADGSVVELPEFSKMEMKFGPAALAALSEAKKNADAARAQAPNHE